MISYDVPMSGETPYFVTRVSSYSPSIVKGHKRIYHYRMNNSNSALTSHAVIYGINALWNIKHVIDWHIYKNYHVLLRLIIATKAYKKYWGKYFLCKLMIPCKFPRAFLNIMEDFNKRQRISLIKHAIFPERYAKKQILHEQAELEKDINRADSLQIH